VAPPLAGALAKLLIAVLDAKYHSNFWRPIRNGDIDMNPAIERDATGQLPPGRQKR
jgi:hypothetical protein